MSEKKGMDEKYLKNISGYINRMLKKGYKKEQIKKALIGVGWPKKIVDKGLEEIKVISPKKEVKKVVRKVVRKAKKKVRKGKKVVNRVKKAVKKPKKRVVRKVKKVVKRAVVKKQKKIVKKVKKVVKRAVGKEELILGEALADIKKELENLRATKDRLDSRLKGIGSDITSTQSQEYKLREQISSLVGKEGLLNRKMNKIKQKLEGLKGKIAKVSKIKDELSEV